MKPSHASASNHACISSAILGRAHVTFLGEPEPQHELPDRERLVARGAEHRRHVALEPLGEALDSLEGEGVVQAVAPEVELVERAAEVLDRALQPDLLPARGLDRLGGLTRGADRELLRARGSRVSIRWDRAETSYCHHQKSWLIDAGPPTETAFMGGVNLTAKALGLPRPRRWATRVSAAGRERVAHDVRVKVPGFRRCRRYRYSDQKYGDQGHMRERLPSPQFPWP